MCQSLFGSRGMNDLTFFNKNDKEDKIIAFMEFVLLWEACPSPTDGLKLKR